jgi:nicotinamidase-related amidase
MPLSTLDRAAALVLIDLQKGIVANIPEGAPAILDRAAALARAFRSRGLPVVLVNVAGAAPGRTQAQPPTFALPPDWTEISPGLDAQPTDLRITKHSWGAFLGTALDAELRSRGVTQIVLGGIATSIGVESTARSAYDLGYNIVFVTDTMSDRSPDAQANSFERIFPRLGELCVTGDVLRALGA